MSVITLPARCDRAAAEAIAGAVNAVIDRPEHRTADLGGTAGTADFTDAVLDHLSQRGNA